MAKLLEGSLARTIGRAASPIFLDATLERDAAVVSPNNPIDPDVSVVPQSFRCKAIEDQWSTTLKVGGLVGDADAKVLILASTLATDPQPLDRITIRGRKYTIVPKGTPGQGAVASDPARATWTCRCIG